MMPSVYSHKQIIRALRSRAKYHLGAYPRFIPGSTLRRATFGTSVQKAIRKKESGPAVRRALAQAALSDELIIKINPERLCGILPDVYRGANIKIWFVVPGNWDRNPFPMSEHQTYRRMADLVREADVRQSKSYKEMQALEASGAALPRRVAKLGNGTIEGYFANYRVLVDTIRKTQTIPSFGEGDGDRYVGVAIGRNGELLQHQKGHHRAFLSQLLPCRSMEVKVLAAHPQWISDVIADSRLSCADAIGRAIARLADKEA